MKKIFKSFTFWFTTASVLCIILHWIGQDSKSVILIGFNPILNLLSQSEATNTFMNSGLVVDCKAIAGSISIYWYIGSVLTMAFYGVVLDVIKRMLLRAKRHTS